MWTQDFDILTDITDVEIIAVGNSIRDLQRLIDSYGNGRWRKLKGLAVIVCWYEAHGIGKRDFKVKRYIK